MNLLRNGRAHPMKPFGLPSRTFSRNSRLWALPLPVLLELCAGKRARAVKAQRSPCTVYICPFTISNSSSSLSRNACRCCSRWSLLFFSLMIKIVPSSDSHIKRGASSAHANAVLQEPAPPTSSATTVVMRGAEIKAHKEPLSDSTDDRAAYSGLTVQSSRASACTARYLLTSSLPWLANGCAYIGPVESVCACAGARRHAHTHV